MNRQDDELVDFEAHGAALPEGGSAAWIDHDGARIWYATFGVGSPVILLHGGLGHSGNWGGQVGALVESGHRVVVIDSRGHGRSTRDDAPFTDERMAFDVLAVMDALAIEQARFVGWSDGAVIALIVAMNAPERVGGVFFFGCNVDPSGTKPFVPSPILDRCIHRHALDYAALSATPTGFKSFANAVSTMQQTQPNFSADDLRAIRAPVVVVQSEHDEFIAPEHAAYLARTIRHARLVNLPGVSHFAPLQRPALFNAAVLSFLGAG